MTTPAKRPSVLFLVHRIPYPPDKGDKIRSFREMEALAERCDLTVACFVDDVADEIHVEKLKEYCREVIAVRLSRPVAKLKSLTALLGRGSLSLEFYRSREMERRLRELAVRRPMDAVLAFSSTMGPYAAIFPGARRVLDLCDLDSHKWERFASASRWPMSAIYASEARRLASYEARAVGEFDATILISEAERDDLARLVPGKRIDVIANGVDLDALDPGPEPAAGDGLSCVFVGAMDYLANVGSVVYFHDEVLPKVREKVPDARFRIVGANPTPEVVRLGETPGVTVTGRVAEVRPEILQCAVSVAPIRLGRGVPNKVLEALALTLPVVTTSCGVAGLDSRGLEGVAVADDADGFAAAVVDLLRSGRSRYPGNREVLRERYSWEPHMRRLCDLVLEGVA